jgi:hypothetical protein
MKAEQRKELETNTLADKVGQAMQRVKGSSRRSALIYLLVGAALLLALFFTYRWYVLGKTEASFQWLMLDDGSFKHLEQLEQQQTPAGRAARFQIAWIVYWEEGVRMIGIDQPGAMKKLREASIRYKDLAKECADADDKIFEPQALLGVAVCEETRAVQDIALLGQAKESYKAVVDKYKDSAEGIFAQKRLDLMNDKTKFAALQEIYEKLQKDLQIPGAAHGFAPGGFAPGLFPPVIEGDDKKPKKN